MGYTVRKNIAGKHRVHYQCPHCDGALESPLEEAGQKFHCPGCGKDVVTPGQADLQRHREELQRERAAEAKRSREKDEERRLRELEITSAAQLAANQRKEAAELRERHRLDSAGDMTSADHLLDLAFKFAKGVSVLVIISCFATTIICLILLLTAQADKVADAVQPFAAPTESDYQQYLKNLSPQSSPSPNPPQDASAQAGTTQVPTLEERFDAIIQGLGVYTQERAMEFAGMDYEAQGLLVDGLEKFIRSVRSSGQRGDAVVWYIENFNANWQAYDNSKKDLQRRREQAALALSIRRQQLLVAVGSAIAVLLSFLFLPLAIQIERNTRRMLELQAAIKRNMPPTAGSRSD